ncbi:MAG: CPBP family intramembrane metalloprotease [Meiothermus sp.]|nr:CPBP family intramembrane metalloprotease [Meiothermus sp.]
MAHPSSWGQKAGALLEVVGVLWLTLWVAFLWSHSLGKLFGQAWENALAHLAFMGVPVLWLWLSGRNPDEFGITLGRWRSDGQAAMGFYLPVALGNGVLGLVDYTSWGGALILVGVNALVLYLVATRKPDPAEGYWMLGISIAILAVYSFGRSVFPGLGQAVLGFVTFALLVGFGEEILYRGFIQSRLNQGFGKPYRWYGVPWGWGALMTALIFGLTHTGIFAFLLWGTHSLTWPWGLWTFFAGLVLGFVREKTGSMVAPAILHGLPQAVAVFFLGW